MVKVATPSETLPRPYQATTHRVHPSRSDTRQVSTRTNKPQLQVHVPRHVQVHVHARPSAPYPLRSRGTVYNLTQGVRAPRAQPRSTAPLTEELHGSCESRGPWPCRGLMSAPAPPRTAAAPDRSGRAGTGTGPGPGTGTGCLTCSCSVWAAALCSTAARSTGRAGIRGSRPGRAFGRRRRRRMSRPGRRG